MTYKHIYTKMNEPIEPFTLDHNNLKSQLLAKGMVVSEGKADPITLRNIMTIVIDTIHFPVSETNTLLINTIESNDYEVVAYNEFYTVRVSDNDHIQSLAQPNYEWICRKVT